MEQVILHLSDLHFGAERGNASEIDKRTLCLSNLLECLKEQPPEWQPNLICISGDIGYSGTEQEYSEATVWLTTLLEVTHLKPSQIILCAGNHDVDRIATRGMNYPPDAPTADDWLSWPIPNHFLKPFDHFISFCKSFGIVPFKIRDEDNYLVGARVVNGIRFVVFNSSWFCLGKNDKSNLWVGLPHIRAVENDNFLKLRKELTDSPCISLIHHPREWLNDSEHTGYGSENRPNTIDYLAERCDLILTGHTHGKIRKPDKIANAAWHITAGATFDNAGHFNNFSIIKVEDRGFTLKRFEFDPRASDHPWGQKGELNFFPFSGYVPHDPSPSGIKETSLISEQFFSRSLVQQAFFPHGYFPVSLVDQKIEEEIGSIRKSRFFEEFNTLRSSLALARKLVEGELSGGTDAVRSWALAWCARFLVRTEELEKAEEYLNLAKGLGNCPEIDIADAFLNSQKGNKNVALKILAGIDSPISRSAALMVVSHHEEAVGAVAWLKTVGFKTTDLDPDGKNHLIMQQLKLAHWDAAKETAAVLTDQDLVETPALHHMKAMTHLLSTVPTEFRAAVLSWLPFEAASFPLASDADSIHARRIAIGHFLDAAEIARQLNCPYAATADDEYALWLELKDPENSHNGRKRLEERLRDPKSALRLIHLGRQFGIELDLKAVEQEIERQIALNGGITQDAALARFALAFTQETPENGANYIAQHYEELSKHLDKKSLRFLQIEMLSRAGFPERANECLDLLLEEGLSAAEESRQRRVIAEADGADPVEIRMLQFKQTGSLGDLASLVDTLESKRDWERLCEYGEILFDRTHTVQDAERLADALSHTYKTERLVELIKANIDLLAQSKNLHMIYCWALYHEGELLEARSELAKLSDDSSSSNYRALQVSIGISLGDWSSLSVFLVNEFQEKDKRSANDLIGAAQLALHLGSPYAKGLIFEAAAKANDDASVLASAYFLATKAGWEDNVEVSQWLHKAAAISGDDGPIQQVSLKEMLDRKPEWDRRESETWQLLSRGEIPQFLAAQSLNKSLIGLMLFPALANLSESDPRRRGAISAYSGQRQPVQFNNVRIIGIDATAFLTLGFLNLLDKALDAFDEVHVPHSTLKWLFEEKQKITFHQPSRIKGAHQVRHMLATDLLEKFIPTTVADSELSAQIGDELASLIAEAKKARDDNTQRIVVRSSPVHRIASLMQEEADLTGHAAVMSSCLSVVKKLRQKGQITAEEEKRATAYLQLHEKPWPHQPEITDGAVLYLDDLAISYFLHLGMLEKLKNAGFKSIASPRVVSEANELIAYESISGKINEVIERIRFAVGSRIESRKIKVSRRRNVDGADESSISEHPTVGLITLARNCDASISDDRFLNQHFSIGEGNEQSPIFSTLELLDVLASDGVIKPDERLEYRTLLRRAGYLFVPISEDELTSYLVASSVKDNKVVETAELKAIRESVLRVRMSNWLQLPKETPWLDMIFQVFNRVLKSMWWVEADLSSVKAYSDWILDQLDIRGWTHSFGPGNGDHFAKTGRGTFILMLLTPPLEAPQEVKDQYWSWIEGRVLAPIKEQYPELYDWIVEWQRNQISKMADIELTDGYDTENNPYIRSIVALAALKIVPPLIHKSLLEKQVFRDEYGIKANATLTFGDSGMSIQRSVLYDAIRRNHSGESELEVIDTDGREWKIMIQNQEGESPLLIISHSKQRFILPDFAEFSPDSVIRLHSINEVAFDVNLPMIARDTWYKILSERAFDDEEIDEFHSDLHDTPIHIARSILEEIRNGQSSISSLVPPSQRYFERLVGCYDGSASIKEYAAGKGKQLFERLSAWNPYDGFLLSLYLSMHSELTAEIVVDHLESEDLVRAFDYLERHGDRISQLGAIEIGLRVLSQIPEIEPAIVRLIKQIRDDDVDGSTSGFKLLVALFVLVDGELSRIRLFSEEPPFYRRLASLTQAALIHRQLVNSGINIERFFKWAVNTRVEQYYFQSLADMRLEPRWNPDLASASQMKAEFFGRIIIAAKSYEKNINSDELYDLVFGTKHGSLSSLVQVHHLYLPGPLEGASKIPSFLPAEISETIETQLGSEEVGISSFIALVNSALIFHIDSHQAELAARALKLGSYRIANVADRSQLLAILNGLASVAAAARSSSLANELQILVRRYRYDTQYTLAIEEAMRICLVAAASHVDLNNWREFVGDWLTEMAFGKLEGNDGEMFLSHLKCLCHAVPELWATCGRADAALKAYNAK
ncbi:metallophosphoesterase [Paenibacillus sp. SI8]|uniref:metallophosphoesterase family protein n=1 Tax=unclassified Paenibacillus TaxID=185978 RepID=UPI003465C816